MRAISLEYGKHYAEALELLTREEEAHLPRFPGLLVFLRGAMHFFLHRSAEALTCYRQALSYEEELDVRSVCCAIGQASEAEGLYPEAAEAYKLALRKEGNPCAGEIAFALGRCYGIMRMAQEAIDAYKDALLDEHFQRKEDAWFKLAEIYQQSVSETGRRGTPPAMRDEDALWALAHLVPGELSAALDQIKNDRQDARIFARTTLLPGELNGDRVLMACSELAKIYARNGNWGKAIHLYVRLVSERGNAQAGVMWPELLSLCKTDGLAEALEQRFVSLAMNREPVDAVAEWQLAGMFFVNMEEYPRAIACFQRALADPNWHLPGVSWHYLGEAYCEMEQPALAIACFHKALLDRRYRAGHPVVWNSLAITYQNIGEPVKARRCFRHLKEAQGYRWSPIMPTELVP